jgi:hypothetical protein
MNDDELHRLLNHADARFRECTQSDAAALVAAVHRRRLRQLRRRRLGVLAILLVATGLSTWSWNDGFWRSINRHVEAVASNAASDGIGERKTTAISESPRFQQLDDEEIARLKAEIAALDAEANQARRFVELYRADEARRQRLAAVDFVPAEPLLPPDVVARLEIDRAAAITVISADVRAKEFNRADEAAESYRSVMKHFPDSRWANIAEQRLNQIQHMN